MSRNLRQSSWSRIPKEVRQALRARVFARDGECQIRAPGCTGRCEEIDHIVPRRVDPSRILDESNCRASCRSCNRGQRNSKTASPSRDW